MDKGAWHVFTMDEFIGRYPSYRDAVEAVLNACDDGRKRPDIHRVRAGFYEYVSPPHGTRQRHYWVTMDAQLIGTTFAHLLEDAEKEAVG